MVTGALRRSVTSEQSCCVVGLWKNLTPCATHRIVMKSWAGCAGPPHPRAAQSCDDRQEEYPPSGLSAACCQGSFKKWIKLHSNKSFYCWSRKRNSSFELILLPNKDDVLFTSLDYYTCGSIRHVLGVMMHMINMIISSWKSFSQSAHFLHKLSAEMLTALLTY